MNLKETKYSEGLNNSFWVESIKPKAMGNGEEFAITAFKEKEIGSPTLIGTNNIDSIKDGDSLSQGTRIEATFGEIYG